MSDEKFKALCWTVVVGLFIICMTILDVIEAL